MFRPRARTQATGQTIAIGPPLIADLDARLGGGLADGRELALAARAIRNQRDHQRWRDSVVEWRTSTADTLEAGFATTAARDALVEIWASDAP